MSKCKYNFHIVQPTKKNRKEINNRIEAAGSKTRKYSTMLVDTIIITASPDFFKGNDLGTTYERPPAVKTAL